MAITDENTVLVLGAGTSVPFGLPLGGDMISDLHAAITEEFRELDSRDDHMGRFRLDINSARQNSSEFRKFPIHGTIARSNWISDEKGYGEGIDTDRDKLKKLANYLENQTSETIDDFIVENPSYAHLAKIGIAASFMNLCYDFERNALRIKPFAERCYGHNPFATVRDESKRNWVHLLINIVRQGIRSGSVSPENKIQIVTFNYDKILEYVLEKQFSNTEAAYPHFSEYIDIIHVHGECGDLSDAKDKTPAQICLDWANGIHVVNEAVADKSVLKAQNSAKRIIKTAKEIYFCGFSFAGPNCRLLGLDEPNKNVGNRTLTYCNYDGSIGISKAVKKFEDIEEPGTVYSKNRFFTYLEENPGTREKPLGIADWLKLGSLGELPG